MELLSKQNILNKGIISDNTRKTTKKTRIIAHNQHLMRVDDEDTNEINDVATNLLLEKIKLFIENDGINGIVFQDYNKGVINSQIIDSTISWANKKGIPVLADPKKINFNSYKNITLFKPNLKELAEGLNISFDINNKELLNNQLKQFISDRYIQSILLTLSEHGIIICSKNEFHHIPAEIRDIADVSGAGDTVISVASLCLATKVPLYETAYVSNLAGGLVCENTGVVPVNKEKLIKELTD